MGRLIVATGLGGWAAIVALWYWLARRSIVTGCAADGPLCVNYWAPSLNRIIVIGLSVGLVYLLGCMCVYAVARSRRASVSSKGWTASRAAQPRSLKAPALQRRSAQP